MKWVVLIFFLPILTLVQGQSSKSQDEMLDGYVNAFLATDQSSQNSESFYQHLDKLGDRRQSFKNDEAFLRFVFSKTHEKFLRNFKSYASFSELFTKGNYNCLTATALYGLVLSHFNVPYQITETNYHIFLTAETTDGILLFEGTDPQGFIVDKKEIDKRIASYRENKINESSIGKTYYHLSCALFREVSLDEIVGLLHYNLAVDAFNHHQLDASINHLDRATAVYCSPRMEELTRIVLLAVVESKLDVGEKESFVKRIQVFRKRNIMALASASSH